MSRMRTTFIWAVRSCALLTMVSCIETQTFVRTPDDALRTDKPPLYCGTFSSFSYYDKNKKAQPDDSLTAVANQLYDQVIGENFKRIPRFSGAFLPDSNTAKELSAELASLISCAQNNQSIRKYKTSPILAKLTAGLPEERYAFIVPTGFNSASANNRAEKGAKAWINRQPVAVLAFGAALSLALTGGTGMVIFVRVGTRPHTNGGSCHLVVYNKNSDEISVYREQYFTWRAGAVDKKSIKKQLQFLLKEYN